MKKNIFVCVFILQLLMQSSACAVSIVYNFRVAQITRQSIGHQTEKRPNSLAVLLFDFFQKTQSFNIRENYAGGLLTYNRDVAKHCYFRADFAVAHAHQTNQGVSTVEVIEPDNILLTAGRNFRPTEKSKVTLSGLLGIPTHEVNTLQRVGFGVGQVGAGVQVDGLCHITKPIDFLWGARYNYFIPRTAFDAQGNCYNFTVGSIGDVLVALQTSNPLSHGLEGGYSGRWGFGAHATPRIPELGLLSYMRNNVYLVYKYTFLRKHFAHRLLLNISYGSDAKPKRYGYDSVMVWGSWGISF